MASSADDVMKKVMRFKLQLTDTTESATVLKILQKLKDLEITLDILAETGIGKTVNSLRRHEQAGEFAKSLVRGWKRLVPKEATSHTDNEEASENLSIKGKLDDQNCPNTGSLTTEDLNNNCLTFHDKSQNSACKAVSETGSGEADSEKHSEKQKRHEDADENEEKSQQENQKNSQNGVSKKKIQFHVGDTENSVISTERKKGQDNIESGDGDTLLGIKNPEGTDQKSRSDSRKSSRSSSDNGRFELEKYSNKKSKSSKEGKETLSESDRFLGISMCSDRKREKNSNQKAADLKESVNQGYPNQHKKSKINYKDKEKDSDQKGPSMSFESYLNYDENVLKRKERPAVKKPPKRIKTGVQEEATKEDGMKAFKSPVMTVNFCSPKKFKETVMDLMNIPSPTFLPEYEKASSAESFEKKVERETDFCDTSTESAVFTGQRLNRKMQVYSGAKTIFLPTMMSLHQQCIRTLQNNINLLYETGGVPFEILEPVLERCTPEQLLRIEECNPIYVGVTDHLWGKHCQRDFKDSKLQEYESWKEMYIRLSEERERKLQRLTKSIVSAHSSKPKGRQVKMAFIHTVAKPPRDVRIQQEIHGTAVPQPHQLRCSVKAQDNRSMLICNEPSRSSRSSSSSSSSGAVNSQDSRKKTRVAPMMIKSLKAFKKQLGRR